MIDPNPHGTRGMVLQVYDRPTGANRKYINTAPTQRHPCARRDFINPV